MNQSLLDADRMRGMRPPLLEADLMRRIDRLVVMPGRWGGGAGPGARRGPGQGAGMELADYRAYAPGDDLRQLDWNAYARLDRPYLRRFVEDQDATLHLLIDGTASMAAGRPSKLDLARRLAAALGYAALSGMDRVLVDAFPEAPAQAGRALRGRGATATLLDQLGRLEAVGRLELEVAVRRHAAAYRQRGPMILISDLWDADWQAGLGAALSAGYSLAVIQVLAPEERDPASAGAFLGPMRLIDSESGERLDIQADGPGLARYRAALAARESEIAAWCRERRVAFASLASDRDPAEAVLGLLRRRGMVD
jgi:uncharacterized protein (DUF58 family)